MDLLSRHVANRIAVYTAAAAEEVAALCGGVVRRLRVQPPAQLYDELGRRLLPRHRPKAAEALLTALSHACPTSSRSYMRLAQIALEQRDWEAAGFWWLRALGQPPRDGRRLIGKLKSIGHQLTEAGRFDVAEEVYTELVRSAPDQPMGHIGLAQVATADGNSALACERWQAALDLFPENLRIRSKFISCLLDILQYDRAAAVWHAAADTKDMRFLALRARILVADYQWQEAIEWLQSLRDKRPESAVIAAALNNRLFHAVRAGVLEADCLGKVIDLQREICEWEPEDTRHWATLASLLIHCGRELEATQLVDRLRPDARPANERMKLLAWRYHQRGDEAQAKEIWNQWLSQNYLPVIHRPIRDLRRVDARRLRISPDEVLLFCPVYNERWRLEWFLGYYRDLGIDRFFFIDNASNDGTVEYLLTQGDVHVYWIDASFHRASSGMRWINELIARHGRQNWCLFVDADEALVYPDAESRDLHQLTRYLARQDHETLFAFLLDMHPGVVDGRSAIRPDVPIEEAFPYFESDYTFPGIPLCPYKSPLGGVRRMFQHAHQLNKVPLVWGGSGLWYLSNHTTTPAVVSNVTGVLKHYKMAGDFSGRCREVSSAKRMSPSCVRRHHHYAEVLEALEEGHDIRGATTVRYEGSGQLVELGLMACPQAYLASAGELAERLV